MIVKLSCPLLDESRASLFDGSMRVAVEADAGESLGEGATGKLLMSGEAAILGNGVGEGECVELDVGVTMYEALLDGGDAITGAVTIQDKER